MAGPGRSRDAATPAELGHDLRPDPADGYEPAPEDRRHDIEHVVVEEEPYAGYELDRCRYCGATARRGDLDPWSRCPARKGARAGAKTDSMLGIPSMGEDE